MLDIEIGANNPDRERELLVNRPALVAPQDTAIDLLFSRAPKWCCETGMGWAFGVQHRPPV